MLVTVAALQLLLAQAPAPPPVGQDRHRSQEVAQAEAAKPEPPPQTGTDTGAAQAPASPPLPERPARAAVTPPRPQQRSLLSGESLGGGTASLAWAGWPSIGFLYGQGITPEDDLAAFGEFAWPDTELRLGGLYRRPLGKAGDFDVAARFTAAWYRNMGATWIHSENHADLGLELGPGVSISRHMGEGIFSTLVEAPLTVTFKYDKGLLFAPRVSVAYEAPLYEEFTLGARLGLGYRAGSGDAPRKEGHGEILFVLMAGYQLF